MGQKSVVATFHSVFSIRSSVDGQIGGVHVLAIGIRTVISSDMDVSLWQDTESFPFTPRSNTDAS